MSLSRKDLLAAAAALKTGSVDLPGGGAVAIRELTLHERGEFVDRVRSDPKSLGAWLVARGCTDEGGSRLLTDDDVKALENSSPAVIDAIGSAILELSGLGQKKDEETDPGEA